jgi:hypothetical protein
VFSKLHVNTALAVKKQDTFAKELLSQIKRPKERRKFTYFSTKPHLRIAYNTEIIVVNESSRQGRGVIPICLKIDIEKPICT